MTSEYGAPAHRPQLDALRALALLPVLYSHYFDSTSRLGLHGVRLFFVISGLLITNVLLGLRSGEGRGGPASLRAALVPFLARRALRIWPAYFLLLFL